MDSPILDTFKIDLDTVLFETVILPSKIGPDDP